jgi:hypothetical protein
LDIKVLRIDIIHSIGAKDPKLGLLIIILLIEHPIKKEIETANKMTDHNEDDKILYNLIIKQVRKRLNNVLLQQTIELHTFYQFYENEIVE